MQKLMFEFFSGSKTIAGVFQKNNWSTFTVDINPKFSPRLCCDISEVTPSLLPNNPNFMWFSPDCSKFSHAANQKHWLKITDKYRQYTYYPQTPEAIKALKMLESSLNVISWFPDSSFIIENPIGRIHHMKPFKKLGHYRYSVNYADFGFPYSKETYLFTNLWLPFSTKKVSSSKPGLRSINNRFQRSIVPPELIQTIINYAL